MSQLVRCPICRHAVAKSARACPSCGAATPGKSRLRRFGLAIVCFGIAGLCMYAAVVMQVPEGAKGGIMFMILGAGLLATAIV